ncbi:MAG: alpha/beta hydrolase [Proteobacteria bacterium]|nr:alpha/beta hydrolase [Pseudomonadota bacterium]
MALDPGLAAFLGSPLAEHPPLDTLTPQILRAYTEQFQLPGPPPAVHETRELTVRGAAGPIRARLYRPAAASTLPVIVFYHGGGFVVCGLDSHDFLCRDIARASGCAVVSVDYRRAPEARFPGPPEDCYAALVDVVRRAAELGVEPSRLAVAGDSAGANLATAVAQLARDRSGPAIRYQALLYPALDPALDSASAHANAEGYMLTRAGMRWYWDQYLASPADAANPLAAPLNARAAGLPAATIITAEFDPLRDEAEQYADRLRAAGVPVVARRYLGMIHGFASLTFLTPVAARAIADVGADVRGALA